MGFGAFWVHNKQFYTLRFLIQQFDRHRQWYREPEVNWGCSLRAVHNLG